ncbi:MAG TPA: glycosyltransferase, partial [Pseudonocardiaceae bacterium]
MLAKRSVRCFSVQTHPRLELVIVSAGDRAYRRALEHHLEHQGISNARVITAEAGSTLGTLRNLSLDAAAGDVVCQWDDDDCCHPDRVLRQVEQMTRQGARACFLTD